MEWIRLTHNPSKMKLVGSSHRVDDYVVHRLLVNMRPFEK